VNVDVDTPSSPAGVRIHADSFTDDNIIVDNDDELYITWNNPSEYNSGIEFFELEVTGIEGLVTTHQNFVKVSTPESGVITANVRAHDRVGHVGAWGSGSIKIDREGLSFTNAVPGEGLWMNSLNPSVGYTISDEGGRFVAGPSVEYAVSLDGGETWGPWTNAGNKLNAGTLQVVVNPSLVEGSDNLVKFMARDEAGNVEESDPIRVNVDVSGLVFEDMLLDGSMDWMGEWIDDGEVTVSFQVSDMYSGVDPSTLEYRFTTRSRNDLETSAWRSKNVVYNDGTVTLPPIELSMGDKNFIQFRGRDMVGNPISYSKVFNVWVNMMPTSIISSPEKGLEVLEGTGIRFDGTMSRDLDGDQLSFSWVDDFTNLEGETVEMVLGEDLEDNSRFDLILDPGTHMITLTVSDGIHEVESSNVTVTVVERIEPIWMTMEDTDGDGMPNIFEYIYHLGWDDPSNKDPAYHDSMAGLSREDIWERVKEEMEGRSTGVDPSQDFDGDGRSDFEEYLQGTNPTDVLDFPKYVDEGKDPKEVSDTLLIVLVVLAIAVMLIVVAVLAANNMMIKNRLKDEEAKSAIEEEGKTRQLLDAGGNQRLAALKAAAEGKATPSLPAPMEFAQALPAPEGSSGPMEAQPITGIPAGWVAAPMAEPMQSEEHDK
jgi:hypothetical protein